MVSIGVWAMTKRGRFSPVGRNEYGIICQGLVPRNHDDKIILFSSQAIGLLAGHGASKAVPVISDDP